MKRYAVFNPADFSGNSGKPTHVIKWKQGPCTLCNTRYTNIIDISLSEWRKSLGKVTWDQVNFTPAENINLRTNHGCNLVDSKWHRPHHRRHSFSSIIRLIYHFIDELLLFYIVSFGRANAFLFLLSLIYCRFEIGIRHNIIQVTWMKK